MCARACARAFSAQVPSHRELASSADLPVVMGTACFTARGDQGAPHGGMKTLVALQHSESAHHKSSAVVQKGTQDEPANIPQRKIKSHVM